MDGGEARIELKDVPVAHREVGGVPAYVGESPGPLSGGLAFRVGQADEALTERGLTHLVEHLAFARAPDLRMIDGAVGLTITSFEARGEPEEVRDFLNGIVLALADLPFERLETERRVLRAEDARRGASLFSFAFYLRFGPAGHGTIDCPELGLPGATADAVDAWRRRWFTRQNAVLWFSGPPPDGIDLSCLPDGERVPPPEPRALPYRYPAWYPGSDGYVAVSMLGRRTVALWAAQVVARERLYARLRTGEGRSYSVNADYTPLTPETSSVYVLTDTLPEEAQEVRDAVSVELARLARHGPDAGEIELLRTMLRRSSHEPGYPASRAEVQATNELAGCPATSVRELDEQLSALRADEVAGALREALDSALWLVPGEIGMDDRRIHRLPDASESAVDGRRFERPRGYPQDRAGDVLVVGPAGVTLLAPQREPATVELARCRAVQAYDDGARALWGADGIRLFLHPGDWRDGEEAMAILDGEVDGALAVAMGEPSGYTPPELEQRSGWRLLGRRR